MTVKHAILALLYQKQVHGYELGKQLSLTLKGDWDVSPGHIAKTLVRLEQANLVAHEVREVEDAPDRKVYRLTDEGLDELSAWYLSPDIHEYKLGNEFYLKLVFSLMGGPVAPEQILMTQRRTLYQELHQITQLRESVDPETDLPWLLLLETVMMHLEADIRWVDMCEARLPDLKRYRPPNPKPLARGRPRRKLSDPEESED